MSTQHTPGPWFASPDSATGQWVVVRKRNAPPNWHPFESMKDAHEKERLFATEGDALSTIAEELRRQIVAHGRSRPAADGEAAGLHYVQCQCERCTEAVAELSRVAKATGSAA